MKTFVPDSRPDMKHLVTVEMEAIDVAFLWLYCLFYAIFPSLIVVALWDFGSNFEVTVPGGVFVCGLGVWRSVFDLTNAFSRLEVDGEGVTRQLYWSQIKERLAYHEITKISRGSVGERWMRMSTSDKGVWILHGWGPRDECVEVFNTINSLWTGYCSRK